MISPASTSSIRLAERFPLDNQLFIVVSLERRFYAISSDESVQELVGEAWRDEESSGKIEARRIQTDLLAQLTTGGLGGRFARINSPGRQLEQRSSRRVTPLADECDLAILAQREDDDGVGMLDHFASSGTTVRHRDLVHAHPDSGAAEDVLRCEHGLREAVMRLWHRPPSHALPEGEQPLLVFQSVAQVDGDRDFVAGVVLGTTEALIPNLAREGGNSRDAKSESLKEGRCRSQREDRLQAHRDRLVETCINHNPSKPLALCAGINHERLDLGQISPLDMQRPSGEQTLSARSA